MADELELATGSKALVDPKSGKPRGLENFSHDDVIVPRIALAQAMSKVVQDREVAIGSLYNTMSRSSYINEQDQPYTEFIVIGYKKSRRLWDKDNKDNSLCMSNDGFKSVNGDNCESECPFLRRDVAKEIGKNPQLTAYSWSEDEKGNRLGPACTLYYNYISILPPFQAAGPFALVSISMGRTNAKIARQFNSIIVASEEDIFARIYGLSTERKENKKGTFYVFKVKIVRKPKEEEYKRAEMIASRLSSMSYSIHEDDSSAEDGTDEIPF